MEDPRGPRPPEALLLVPCAAAARIGATRHATISWMPGRLLATTDPLNETPLHELARLTSPHARGTRLLSTAIPLFLPSFLRMRCDKSRAALLHFPPSSFFDLPFSIAREKLHYDREKGSWWWSSPWIILESTIRNVCRKLFGRVSFKLALEGNSKNFVWHEKDILDLECLIRKLISWLLEYDPPSSMFPFKYYVSLKYLSLHADNFSIFSSFCSRELIFRLSESIANHRFQFQLLRSILGREKIRNQKSKFLSDRFLFCKIASFRA